MSEPTKHGLTLLDFDGATIHKGLDAKRLTGQLSRVYELMKDGQWRIKWEIMYATGDTCDAAIGARLCDLRKDRFGGHTVLRRRRGDPTQGLHEYKLVLNEERGNPAEGQ